MQKTKIEWVKNPDGTQGYSWNPILGICPVECKLPNGKIYCYARKRYIRFNLNPTIRPSEEYPNIVVMPLLDRKQRMISRKVFVCSEFELFHPSVKKEWRDWIFDSIKYNHHLTFQILTKLPHLIDRPMPDNVWLGVTIENNNDWAKVHSLEDVVAKIRFVSLEPFLYFEELSWDYMNTGKIHWWIIGKLTGHGKKYDPTKMCLEYMVKKLRKYNIPIFLKNNLKEIWGKPLIQEMPK